MADVIILLILAVVVYFISAPLRAEREKGKSAAAQARVAELEAARDAKYHEIRDAELDLRTGKLSDQDYEAIDGALRAEAVEIMRALDEELEPGTEAESGAAEPPVSEPAPPA